MKTNSRITVSASQFVVGELVETKVVRGPLTGRWLPARIEAVHPHSEVIDISLMNNKCQVKKYTNRVPISSVRKSLSQLHIGDSVKTKILGGKYHGVWVPARVINVNDDGTYDIFIDDFKKWNVPVYRLSVLRKNLKHIIRKSHIENSCSFSVGHSRAPKNGPDRPSDHWLKSQFKAERRSSTPMGRILKSRRTGRSNSVCSRISTMFSHQQLFNTGKVHSGDAHRPACFGASSPFSSLKLKLPRSRDSISIETPIKRPSVIVPRLRSTSAPASVDSAQNSLEKLYPAIKVHSAESSPSACLSMSVWKWQTADCADCKLDNLNDQMDIGSRLLGDASPSSKSITPTVSNWENMYEWSEVEDESKHENWDKRTGSRAVSETVWTDVEWGDDVLSPIRQRITSRELQGKSPLTLHNIKGASHDEFEVPISALQLDEQLSLHRSDRQGSTHCQRQSSTSTFKTLSMRNADYSSGLATSPGQTPLSEELYQSDLEYSVSVCSKKERSGNSKSLPREFLRLSGVSSNGKKKWTKHSRRTDSRHKRVSTIGVNKHKIRFSELDMKTPLHRIASWLSEDARRRAGSRSDLSKHPVTTFTYNNNTIPFEDEKKVPLERAKPPRLEEIDKQNIDFPSKYSLLDVLGPKSLDTSTQGLAFFVGPVDGRMSYKVSICDIDQIQRLSRGNTPHEGPGGDISTDDEEMDDFQLSREDAVTISTIV